MSPEAAEASLSSGQSPALQCTARAPSPGVRRARLPPPALSSPGTQGPTRTNQANCLSSPRENVVAHISPDNMRLLPGQSFFSFKTSQPCSGFWVSPEGYVHDGKTCASRLRKTSLQLPHQGKAHYRYVLPLVTSEVCCPLRMCQYLLSSPPPITWCITTQHGTYQAACE